MLKFFNRSSDPFTSLPGLRWTTLKSILDNKTVASTYVWILALPILMSVTSKFPLELPVAFGHTDSILIFNLSIPYNWYLMYFSAVCFAAARMVYTVSCPTFLKQYSSPPEAMENGITPSIFKEIVADYLREFQNRSLHPLSDEGICMSALLPTFSIPGTYVRENFEAKKQGDFSALLDVLAIKELQDRVSYQVANTHPDFNIEQIGAYETKSLNLTIWRFIELQQVSNNLARLIASCVVVVGFILVSIPFLQGFIAVWRSWLGI